MVSPARSTEAPRWTPEQVTGRQAPRGPAKARALTSEQLAWIRPRDAVGQVIDGYVRTRPAIEMLVAIELAEDGLARGDAASGLL